MLQPRRSILIVNSSNMLIQFSFWYKGSFANGAFKRLFSFMNLHNVQFKLLLWCKGCVTKITFQHVNYCNVFVQFFLLQKWSSAKGTFESWNFLCNKRGWSLKKFVSNTQWLAKKSLHSMLSNIFISGGPFFGKFVINTW